MALGSTFRARAYDHSRCTAATCYAPLSTGNCPMALTHRRTVQHALMGGAVITYALPDESIMALYWNGPGARLRLFFGDALVTIDPEPFGWGMPPESVAAALSQADTFVSACALSIIDHDATDARAAIEA